MEHPPRPRGILFPGEGCSRLHPNPSPNPEREIRALRPRSPSLRGQPRLSHCPHTHSAANVGGGEALTVQHCARRAQEELGLRSKYPEHPFEAPRSLLPLRFAEPPTTELQKKADSCRPLRGHVSPGRARPPARTERLHVSFPRCQDPQPPNRAQGPPLSEQLPGSFLPGGGGGAGELPSLHLLAGLCCSLNRGPQASPVKSPLKEAKPVTVRERQHRAS